MFTEHQMQIIHSALGRWTGPYAANEDSLGEKERERAAFDLKEAKKIRDQFEALLMERHETWQDIDGIKTFLNI